MSKERKREWQLAFGQVTGLEVGKTYAVYEAATSKENSVDKNKDNILEENYVIEHKKTGDKAQTFVVTLGVPKEDMSEPANRVRFSSNTNSNTSLPKTGEKMKH